MANGFHNDQSNGRLKQCVMENCFPPPPLPDEGFVSGSVKEEYDEYTMDEIINGRVNHLNVISHKTISLILCASFPLFWFLIG